MGTVEKVELENGVTLGERMEQSCGVYGLSKDEVRTVFLGKVEKIACHCVICFRTSEAHADDFDVEYYASGCISIGCVDFNQEQVAQVKKWLGE